MFKMHFIYSRILSYMQILRAARYFKIDSKKERRFKYYSQRCCKNWLTFSVSQKARIENNSVSKKEEKPQHFLGNIFVNLHKYLVSLSWMLIMNTSMLWKLLGIGVRYLISPSKCQARLLTLVSISLLAVTPQRMHIN